MVSDPRIPAAGLSEGPPDPPARQPHIIFRRPAPLQSIRGMCLSHAPLVIWTHWLDERTQPCCRDRGHCPGCHLERRWNAWIAVLPQFSAVRQEVWTITRSSLLYAQALDGNERPWRGRAVKITRDGPSPRSPISVERSRTFHPERGLPAPCDVFGALLVLWGLAPEGGKP